MCAVLATYAENFKKNSKSKHRGIALMCLQHLTLLVCVSQTLVLTIISYSVLNDIFQLLKQTIVDF